ACPLYLRFFRRPNLQQQLSRLTRLSDRPGDFHECVRSNSFEQRCRRGPSRLCPTNWQAALLPLFAPNASQHSSTRSEKPQLPVSVFARFGPVPQGKRHAMVNQMFPVVTGSECFSSNGVDEFSANSKERRLHRLPATRRWEIGTMLSEACIPFYQLGVMICSSTRTQH